MEKVLFSEEQRFNQWWHRLIMLASLAAVLIPFAIGFYSQVILDKPFGNDPMSTEGLTVTGLASGLIMAIIAVMMFVARLNIKVTHEALWVSFPPFVRKWKKILPDEIHNYKIRTYKAKREYGGHGKRQRLRSGQAYTVSGNIGLQLYLKNGKKLLIGTQKKQALEYAMRKLMEGEE